MHVSCYSLFILDNNANMQLFEHDTLNELVRIFQILNVLTVQKSFT